LAPLKAPEGKSKSSKKLHSTDLASGSTLRALDQLLKEVALIHMACGGREALKEQAHLDDFQSKKAEFHELLATIKDDIKIYNDLEERTGKTAQTVQLKHNMAQKLEQAKTAEGEMRTALEKDRSKFQKKKKDALDEDQLKDREEVTRLLHEDLKYTEALFKRERQLDSGGFNIARNARERRRQQREQGNMEPEPIPLSAAQQQFVQESLRRDVELDEKLDIILENVRIVRQIAGDIEEEFVKQDFMLKELEHQFDDVDNKIRSGNAKMQSILAATGGAMRWIPILILCVILVALVGYVYAQLRAF